MPSVISAVSIFIATVILLTVVNASITGMDDRHPMVRYRSQTQLSPFSGLYLKPTAKRLRVEQLSGNSRNCFFSPVQCRLPVAEIGPQPIESPRSRFRRQKNVFSIPSSASSTSESGF
uniref:Secreted protein n=1 Tax=Panagrolaimus superbus TaxID=310955 RepID=A0A914YP59_9BILA